MRKASANLRRNAVLLCHHAANRRRSVKSLPEAAATLPQNAVFFRQSAAFCRQFSQFCRQSAENCRQFSQFCRQSAENCRQFSEFCRQFCQFCRQFLAYFPLRLAKSQAFLSDAQAFTRFLRVRGEFLKIAQRFIAGDRAGECKESRQGRNTQSGEACQMHLAGRGQRHVATILPSLRDSGLLPFRHPVLKHWAIFKHRPVPSAVKKSPPQRGAAASFQISFSLASMSGTHCSISSGNQRWVGSRWSREEGWLVRLPARKAQFCGRV